MTKERSLAEQCADIAFNAQGVPPTRSITLSWHTLVDVIDSAIELQKLSAVEPSEKVYD